MIKITRRKGQETLRSALKLTSWKKNLMMNPERDGVDNIKANLEHRCTQTFFINDAFLSCYITSGPGATLPFSLSCHPPLITIIKFVIFYEKLGTIGSAHAYPAPSACTPDLEC